MNNPALLIIDLQKGFDQEAHWGGQRNNRIWNPIL